MKKLFFFLFTVWSSFLCADRWTTEIRAGFFCPWSTPVRSLYHPGGTDVELEQTVRLYKDLRLWVNANFFSKNKCSLPACCSTSLALYPLSIGLKYQVDISVHSALYVGLGGSYTFVRQCHISPFAVQQCNKNRFGWVVKTGLLVPTTRRWFINFFADFYSTTATIRTATCNVGGLRTGVGVGVRY